jgi:hypothetical protein
MARRVALSLGLGCPELRRVTHSARTAETRPTTSLDGLAAHRAGLPPCSAQWNASPMDDRVAGGTQRFTVADCISQVGMSLPRLDVVSVQMVRGPAFLAGIPVTLKDSLTPLLVAPCATLCRRQYAFVQAGRQVATGVAAILRGLPLTLREELTAAQTRELGRGVVVERALGRAGDPAISRRCEERLSAGGASLGAARIAKEVPRVADGKRLAALLAPALKGVLRWGVVHGTPVRVLLACLVALFNLGSTAGVGALFRLSAHTAIIAHFRALERLSGMGLTPRLAE